MHKLVLKSDHAVEIVGIIELVHCIAQVMPDSEGWAYGSSGSEMLWDTQAPVEPRIWVDTEGFEHEGDVEVIDV